MAVRVLRFCLFALFIVLVDNQGVPATVDSAIGPRKPNCPSGFMDITRGNAYWWRCGTETCPGDEPWTKQHCGCACVTPEVYWAFWQQSNIPATTTPPTTVAPTTVVVTQPNLGPVPLPTTVAPAPTTTAVAGGGGQGQGNNNGVPGVTTSPGAGSGGSNSGGEGGIIGNGDNAAAASGSNTSKSDNDLPAVLVGLFIILGILCCICIIVLVVLAYVKGMINPVIKYKFEEADKVHPEESKSETEPDAMDVAEAEAARVQNELNGMNLQLGSNLDKAHLASPRGIVNVDVSPRGRHTREEVETRKSSYGSSNQPMVTSNSSGRLSNAANPSPRASPRQNQWNSPRSQNADPAKSPRGRSPSPAPASYGGNGARKQSMESYNVLSPAPSPRGRSPSPARSPVTGQLPVERSISANQRGNGNPVGAPRPSPLSLTSQPGIYTSNSSQLSQPGMARASSQLSAHIQPPNSARSQNSSRSRGR